MEVKALKPKRQPLSSELNDDYVLIYKDVDNILDDIDFVVDDDRILCKTIIDSLEKEAAAQLLAGKCVQLPYIGVIRRSPIKMALIKHYKEFKEKRSQLSREDYIAYCKKVMRQEKIDLRNAEIHKRKMNTFRKKNLKIWMEKKKAFGNAYANVYLYVLRYWTAIDFDWDVELAYQENVGNG